MRRVGQEGTEDLIKENGVGIVFGNYDDLSETLYDSLVMQKCGETVIEARKRFSFDAAVPKLTDIFRKYT